jgi:cell division protein FtsI (penicillin-binding protein 3)
MIQAVRKRKRRKRRLYIVGILVILLAATGGTLHRLSLSLQDISRIIQLAAGKISNGNENVIPVEANLRGTIYDRNFNELSVSYQLFTLYAHPSELADRHSSAEKLALILGTDKDILADRLNNVKPVIEIADDLDMHQAAEVAALDMDGVYCKPVEERFYPIHRIAAHLLGFTGNSTGLAGVEALYDQVLQPGVFRRNDAPEVDIDGVESAGLTTTDVILTIDLGLQKEVEQQLRSHLQSKGAARGIALVMEPGTGRVLTMASQPGFDPNYFWQSESQHLQDQVFQPVFEQDLLKPLLLTAAAIYEAGLDGEILPVTVRAPDYGLTEEKLAEYRLLFGLQEPVPSILPSDKEPARADVGEMGPCRVLSGAQMEVALAALLNGGSRVKPWLLESLYDHNRNRFYPRAVESTRHRILPPAQGINLRRELLQNSPYSGKNGFLFVNKSITIGKNKGFSDYRIQEVLLAAVPDKAPKVLLLMAFDYGSLYPLPPGAVGRKKKKKNYLADMGHKLLPVLMRYGMNEQVAERPVGKNEGNYRRFLIVRRLELPEQKKHYAEVDHIMPALKGLSLRKGLQRISPYHLKVSVQGSGHIVGQNPAPGEPLAKNGVCELTLQAQL